MKKHFLTYHKLEELSKLAQLHDIVYEKFDVVIDSPAETTNVLVDKPPLCAKKLPTDIQTLRQKIIDHQKTKQGQRS